VGSGVREGGESGRTRLSAGDSQRASKDEGGDDERSEACERAIEERRAGDRLYDDAMMCELKLSAVGAEKAQLSARRPARGRKTGYDRETRTDCRVAVEGKVGREIDDVGAVARNLGRHAAAGGQRVLEPGDAGVDRERLRARARREGDGAR
jgi:hypothetical protein